MLRQTVNAVCLSAFLLGGWMAPSFTLAQGLGEAVLVVLWLACNVRIEIAGKDGF